MTTVHRYLISLSHAFTLELYLTISNFSRYVCDANTYPTDNINIFMNSLNIPLSCQVET